MSNTVGKLIEELLEVFKKNYKRPRLWICLGLIIFALFFYFHTLIQISCIFQEWKRE